MKASAPAVPLVVLAAIAFCAAAFATSADFGPWSPATRVEAVPGTGATRTGGGAEGDSDHYVTTRDQLR